MQLHTEFEGEGEAQRAGERATLREVDRRD